MCLPGTEWLSPVMLASASTQVGDICRTSPAQDHGRGLATINTPGTKPAIRLLRQGGPLDLDRVQFAVQIGFAAM